jgi:acetate kinase
MNILVLNAGSTSLKFALFASAGNEALMSGGIDWPDGNRDQARLTIRRAGAPPELGRVNVPNGRAAAQCAIEVVSGEYPIGAAGHRVVHGGGAFRESRLVDGGVKSVMAGLVHLAPLHNPPALEAIEGVEKALPGVSQVAVFDTAFFSGLPEQNFLFGLPYAWKDRWGARRYGFHGISNAYCAGRAAELLGRRDLRLVTCHLGGGCSATAVKAGIPVRTTMGFSTLDGLMMGTRCGAVDPGLLVYLQRDCGVKLEELDHALTCESGLLGISGISADMAQIEAAAEQGNARAQLAFGMFADQVRAAIGGLAVGMGGLDALVFTDRIGENSPKLRAAACQGLECLGVHLDEARNRSCSADADVAAPESPVRVLVLRTREELMIARETRRVVAAARDEPLSGKKNGIDSCIQ